MCSSDLLAEMNGSEGGSISGAGQEVKARRREVRLPGKEEEIQVQTHIYLDLFPEALERKTGSENHWRAFSPPSFRQQRSHP